MFARVVFTAPSVNELIERWWFQNLGMLATQGELRGELWVWQGVTSSSYKGNMHIINIFIFISYLSWSYPYIKDVVSVYVEDHPAQQHTYERSTSKGRASEITLNLRLVEKSIALLIVIMFSCRFYCDKKIYIIRWYVIIMIYVLYIHTCVWIGSI